MMSEDKVITFKDFTNECRHYFTYVDNIRRLTQQKEGIIHRMEGVHSIDFQRPAGHDKGRVNYDIRLGLIKAKDEVDEEINENMRRIQWILAVIDNIPNHAYRPMMWKAYIQRIPVSTLSKTVDYATDSLLKEFKRQINASLEIVAKMNIG